MSTARQYERPQQDQRSGSALEEHIRMEELEVTRLACLQKSARTIRMLIVDDDQDALVLLSHMLENIGIEVSTASCGNEGLAKAISAGRRGSDFDIILVDIQMPDLDGYSMAGILRWRGFAGSIIAMTGRPLVADLDEYREAGCNYFVTKGEIQYRLPRLIAQCLGN